MRKTNVDSLASLRRFGHIVTIPLGASIRMLLLLLAASGIYLRAESNEAAR